MIGKHEFCNNNIDFCKYMMQDKKKSSHRLSSIVIIMSELRKMISEHVLFDMVRAKLRYVLHGYVIVNSNSDSGGMKWKHIFDHQG